MGSSVHVQESVEIARPPSAVWEVIADYGFDHRWRSGLRDMTPDPPGGPAVGTKVHEVVRNAGRDYVADTFVTSLDPGRSYEFSGEGTIGGLQGARSVEPNGDDTGSVFTYEIRLEPRGAMRLMRPVLGPMVRSGLKGDLETLRGLLEREAPAEG